MPARTVVCFGDSNTYGTPAMAGPDDWGRFGPDERWPGILRGSLGSGYIIVEEGLPGRTTVHDDPIEGVDKNGLTALPMVLGSHRPIDLLIITLGTNDLKARFAVTAQDIAASVGVLVRHAQASPAGPDSTPPKILVIVPAPIFETGFMTGHFAGGAAKSQLFGRCYTDVMARLGVPVLDAGQIVQSDPLDGIHLSRDSHAALGRAVAQRVTELIG